MQRRGSTPSSSSSSVSGMSSSIQNHSSFRSKSRLLESQTSFSSQFVQSAYRRFAENSGSFRISHGKHLEIKEAEILHRSQEPGNVTDDFFAPREPSGVADGRRVSEFPYNIIVDEHLPSYVVIHECLDMPLQEIGGNSHRSFHGADQ